MFMEKSLFFIEIINVSQDKGLIGFVNVRAEM